MCFSLMNKRSFVSESENVGCEKQTENRVPYLRLISHV